jgi:hypothetical protein
MKMRCTRISAIFPNFASISETVSFGGKMIPCAIRRHCRGDRPPLRQRT